jgi:site-specific recombinase XerD
MNKLDPLLEGYLSYLRDVGRKTARTVVDVRCTLRRASLAFEVSQPAAVLWKLTLGDVLAWLQAERGRGRAPSCINKYVSHLRGLFDYAWRSGRSERNVLDGFSLNDSVPHCEPRSLTLEEAARLIGACPAASPHERRDRVMVLLLYGCGLRTSELCALDLAHIDRERQELVVAKAKHDRPRTIPVPDGVYTELLAYVSERGKRGALFRTRQRNCRIRSHDVCDAVSAAAERAGLTGSVTPKALRHSFATHLMDRGVDLAIIASLMGHRSPQETGVYLHVLPGRKEQAVRKLPGGTLP